MIFANIMLDKKRLPLFWKTLLKKYRFVIMTDDSFEERFSVKLNRLTLFAFLGGGMMFCFVLATFLLTTSLTEYIPGKANAEVQKELMLLSEQSDSLLAVLNFHNSYMQNLRNIVAGNELIAPKTIESTKNLEEEISFKKSIEDSLLRAAVESEDKGVIRTNIENYTQVLLFFPPIKGMITDQFNAKTKHFGIDLVAKEKTRISTVLEGTVIISNWTSETGYVIGIQHKNDYISLYKHNSILLKDIGDFVTVGEPIAIIGNSGELSSGPHLHFELWHQGEPVNPENYILF